MIFCTRFSKQRIFSKAKNLKFGKRNRAKICAFTAKFKSVILHENPNKKVSSNFFCALKFKLHFFIPHDHARSSVISVGMT